MHAYMHDCFLTFDRRVWFSCVRGRGKVVEANERRGMERERGGEGGWNFTR